MEAKFFAAAALIATLFTPPAGAISPHWSYRVLHSPHFEIVHRDTQKELAKRYILAAEQAYELLVPIFKEAPDKTIVFLQDDTDGSNGAADFLPYPHITVYPVLPSTRDTIDGYGDWPLEMMVHEYTHILNMYPAHGIYTPFKYILGTIVRPNAVLPRWYLEGLAVDLESTLTSHGRLRSPETHASARALYVADRLHTENVATINEGGIPSWPYGGRPYLYGGWWWEGVTEKSTDVVGTWNQNFSRRLPFLLNGPMREQTGKSAGEIMSSTAERLEKRAKTQVEAIRAAGTPLEEIITDQAGEQSVFALSPSGKRLVYWLGSPIDGTFAYAKVRTENAQKFADIAPTAIFRSPGAMRARFIDEDHLVFDQLDIVRPFVNYRELYAYDFTTNKVERLTQEARAQEPAPSPNGRLIAFIQSDGGRNHLALYDVATKKVRPLLHGSYSQRLSGPEFLDERRIAFALRERDGRERLQVFDLQTREIKPLDTPLQNAQNLRRTSRGYLVTDAGTGARNAYLIAGGRTIAVTNTLTDVQDADYDPLTAQIIVSELTADGRRMRAYPFAEHKPPTLDLKTLPAPPALTTTKVSVREESYQPIEYLRPHYLLPMIYQADQGYLFTASTSGEDPAKRNAYGLLAQYDTITKKPGYRLDYTNRSLPTDIGIYYGKIPSYLGASGSIVESQAASLTFSQHWPFNDRNFTWAFGGTYNDSAFGDTGASFRRLGPTAGFALSRLNNPKSTWHTYKIDGSHTEYLARPGYLAYGRSYLHTYNSAAFGNGRRLTLQMRGSLAPKIPFGLSELLALGDRSVSGNYFVNLANSDFLLRGYPSGEFVGRKMLNANLEYVFPALRLDRGWGTFPFFLQQMEFALITDAMSVDGAAYDAELPGYVRRKLSQFALGSGAELRLGTTAGYSLPISFTLGLYYGYETRFGGGFTPFVALGFGGLPGLGEK